MRSYVLLCSLSLLTAVVGVGCHGGSNSSSAAAAAAASSLRLANATPAASVSLTGVGVSDATVTVNSGAVAQGTIGDYKSLSAQSYTIGVGAADGSLTAATQSIGLTAAVNYTLVAFARNGAINTYTLADNQIAPAAGFALLTIANGGGDAGTLDVYLVAPSASLTGVAPVFTAIAPKGSSSSKAVSAGTYDVVVTASGKPNDVRLTIPSVTLASSDIMTLGLTSTIGGSLVDGQLIKQGGTMQLAPSTFAHVRLVGSFPANGATNDTVSASIGGTSFGTLTAPSLGTYKLITGGTSTYSVSVDGVDVTNLPAATFANGGDYTVLVSGTPTTPVVQVLTDNNQLSSNGYANIRLVNAGVAGSVTLYDNYVPVNIDVQYDTASDYAPATPLSTSQLQITSPVAAFPTYNAANVNIATGGVYTVFILGTSSNPIVSLSKDR